VRTILIIESCTPELDQLNTCNVVIGRMRIFLSSKDTIVDAIALVMRHIQEAYDDPSFVDRVGSGLVNIHFLAMNGGNDENTPPINDNENPDSENDQTSQGSGSGLAISSLLSVAVGSAALVVFVGSVYFWRRGRSNDDDDGVHGSSATRLASLTINDTETFENEDKNGNYNNPPSPYSEMVSNSYRLDRLAEMSILSSSNMSPVYELDGAETDNDTVVGATSVMISEGGYTTDAGGTEEGDSTYFESTTVSGSKYSSHSTPNVLGARPFPGTIGNIDMEEISDSDLDTSGEMSPVKMYIGTEYMKSNSSKLLVLPSGRDPMDEENEDHDDSLLFGSPVSASKNATVTVDGSNRNISAPTDESDVNSPGDVESIIESMSRTSPMSNNTAPSFPSF
jgi:hypothetical protein